MRIVFLGAGGTGGYYGGRLAAAGADVTFLVRPERAKRLAQAGLTIISPIGGVATPVQVATDARACTPCDAVVFSAKAYDLDSAIETIAPAVGPNTLILPLLNGMRHLDDLDARFGSKHVLGGTCHISVTLRDDGVIEHFSTFDALSLGPRSPGQVEKCTELANELKRGGFEVRLSENITGVMWEKWALLATLAGSTCLMRASVGEIARTPGGADFVNRLLDECCAIAESNGHAPRPAVTAATRTTLTDPQSNMSASMRRDLEAGRRTEARHILGDLIARAHKSGTSAPLLETAFIHLEAHERRLTV